MPANKPKSPHKPNLSETSPLEVAALGRRTLINRSMELGGLDLGIFFLRYYPGFESQKRSWKDSPSAVQLHEVWYTNDPVNRECSWSRVLASMKTASVPLAGLGSSGLHARLRGTPPFLPITAVGGDVSPPRAIGNSRR